MESYEAPQSLREMVDSAYATADYSSIVKYVKAQPSSCKSDP